MRRNEIVLVSGVYDRHDEKVDRSSRRSFDSMLLFLLQTLRSAHHEFRQSTRLLDAIVYCFPLGLALGFLGSSFHSLAICVEVSIALQILLGMISPGIGR